MMFQLSYTHRAGRDIRELDALIQKRIRKKLDN